MESKTQKAVIINNYGKKPEFKQDYPKPMLKEGELLIKVEGSTINPADRFFLQGLYSKKPLPAVGGFQGTGRVVEAKGQAVQSWVGKRVCFFSYSGSWCQFAVSRPETTIQIDLDVPLCSASSGFVNPLTALGILETFKQTGCKGMMMTAGASALGKMVNRLCLKQGIPLLSLVRKQEQAYDLKKQGAQHILLTKGNWEKQLIEQIQNFDFYCVFDALGGGPVTETIINSLGPKGRYYMISHLEKKSFHLDNPSVLYSGVQITGFTLLNWWAHISQEMKKSIRSQYSSLLKNELRTRTCKEVSLKNIHEAVQLSASKANQGKVLLKIQ